MSTYMSDLPDRDPEETRDWTESVAAVIQTKGRDRARLLLARVLEAAQRQGVMPVGPLVTDFVNTIPVDEEPEFPGDDAMEKRIRRMIRWNAMAMVQRANMSFDGIGGHLSTYASSASLYEIGFNHFFRGKEGDGAGDHIYFQGHAAPGIYSRSFLEGRLTEADIDGFRREAGRGTGLSSYPHPRLMPDYWEFPTVSMGLGPLSAIYQARFNRYLHARGIVDTSASRIWCFMGDGESDEPESLGSLSVASREGLDNLIFVVNCNLQRLDGPVRGNGKIVQELEAVFRGSGWHVIKVIWGPEWDEILARDSEGVLREHMNRVVDGQWQRFTTASGATVRRDFFGQDPRLLELVSDISDEKLGKLRRGGHSYHKLYAAYHQATQLRGRPVVILAHTVKGWTLGEGFEGSNVTHQKKKLELDEIRAFRDLLDLPVPDSQLKEAPFFHPGMDSPEVEYMLARRKALGGCIPVRKTQVDVKLELPGADLYREFMQGMSKGEASTTMVFARLLSKLIRDKKIGRRIVPIIPDEARTFGMDALFSQVGIYAQSGQLYEPIDKGKLLYYRESRDGQVLEEGITEAGSMASFTAAATSYATHGQPMIPFYIFYSMFGFQRTGDQIWAAGDSMARGFLLGATAGRTTLNGEGLQHEDGHSHVLASVIPNCLCYDVAYAYELATIVRDGMRRMFDSDENVLYYITLYNENYRMPPRPQTASDEGILGGLYRYRPAEKRCKNQVELLSSGPLLNHALRAQEILMERFDVSSDVWSVTSYGQLRKDALSAERYNRLHPGAEPRTPYITRALDGVEGPFVAASDYMKSHPDGIARFVPGRFVPLGTDGFGMSDTREALRRHFEVDAENMVLAALDALRLERKIEPSTVARAIREFGIAPEKVEPTRV